jgi:hypothetical protein
MLVLVILLVFWQRNYNLACTTASEMAQAFDDAEHQARQLLDSVPIRPGCVTATVSSSPSMRPISGSAGKSRAEVIGKKVSMSGRPGWLPSSVRGTNRLLPGRDGPCRRQPPHGGRQDASLRI